MIVVPRLGDFANQIFQYAYLRTKFPDDVIVFIGGFKFQEILLIEDNKAFFFGEHTFFFRLLKYFFQWLVKLKVVDELNDKNCFDGNQRKSIIYAKGFFQFPGCLSEKTLRKIRLRDEFVRLAISEYAKKNMNPNNSFFVHVRMGDYSSFPSKKYPAILEPSFFLKEIKNLQHKGEFVNIFLQEDDYKFNKLKDEIDNSEIFFSSVMLDFYMMACCGKGGILSASTFSYWAAYFSHIENNTARYIAPKYWSGWRMEKWHPHKMIKVDWIEYKNV